MKKVLIVDDSEMDSIRFEHFLKGTSFEVLGNVDTIESAKASIDQNKPDVVLLDIYLRDGENGLDLLDYLKERGIAVLVISGSGDIQDYFESRTQQGLGFLTKPVSKVSLNSMLNWVTGYDGVVVSKDDDHLYLREGNNRRIKLLRADVLFLEASLNYCYVITRNRKYILKRSLTKLIEEFSKDFVRISNQHAINLRNLESYTSTEVVIGGTELKIGVSYRKKWKEYLHAMNR